MYKLNHYVDKPYATKLETLPSVLSTSLKDTVEPVLACRSAIIHTQKHSLKEGQNAGVLATPFVYTTILRSLERDGGCAGSHDRCEYSQQTNCRATGEDDPL
ncbi:hypothetical protein E2C01_091930 [Portunus trituberculatus]|uniref:Uncharacterized protein n=1 Tax=Portunus trituberculatus TaxID=210409 RepID=A0A5B7JPA7_PORTR|nr:hypothetical protein [Portunus trituberculatus]